MKTKPESNFPPFLPQSSPFSFPEFNLNMADEVKPRPKTTRCESSIQHVFSGTLVHSTEKNMMDICQKRIIGVDDDGKVSELTF